MPRTDTDTFMEKAISDSFKEQQEAYDSIPKETESLLVTFERDTRVDYHATKEAILKAIQDIPVIVKAELSYVKPSKAKNYKK